MLSGVVTAEAAEGAAEERLVVVDDAVDGSEKAEAAGEAEAEEGEEEVEKGKGVLGTAVEAEPDAMTTHSL